MKNAEPFYKRTKEEDTKFLAELGYPPLSDEDFDRVSELMDRRKILGQDLAEDNTDEFASCLIESEGIYRRHQDRHDSAKIVNTAARLATVPIAPHAVPAPTAVRPSSPPKPIAAARPAQVTESKPLTAQYRDLLARERKGECAPGSASKFFHSHQKEINTEQLATRGFERTPAGNNVRRIPVG